MRWRSRQKRLIELVPSHRIFHYHLLLLLLLVFADQPTLMSSTDDSYSMSCSLPSSLEQTPLSSLSAASSYSSLVNCDEAPSIHHHQEQEQQPPPPPPPPPVTQPLPIIKKNEKISDTTIEVTQTYNNINKRSPYSTLLNRHIHKLCSILERSMEIHGQGTFPTLNIVPKDFLNQLRRAFHTNDIDISDIRLNGGKHNNHS